MMDANWCRIGVACIEDTTPFWGGSLKRHEGKPPALWRGCLGERVRRKHHPRVYLIEHERGGEGVNVELFYAAYTRVLCLQDIACPGRWCGCLQLGKQTQYPGRVPCPTGPILRENLDHCNGSEFQLSKADI